MLIAAACMSWGIDNNLTRKLSSADPVQIAILKGLVAGTVNMTLALAQGAALPGAGTVLAAGVVGFLGYGVSLALFVSLLEFRTIRCGSRECAKVGYMQPGILIALLSAVLFGASTPLAKMMLGNVDPWMMAGLLYLGAGLGLAAVHLSRSALRLPAVEAPLRRSDMPWLVAVIAAGGILGPLFLMFGLARTDAAGASLLLNLEGLATMGIAWLLFRENVDRRSGGQRLIEQRQRKHRADEGGQREIGPRARRTIKTLEDYGYPTEGMRSKNLEEFATSDAPKMDFVFTVCDNAAGEACPVWPGLPMTAHWGIEDPAAVDGIDIEKQRAFNLAFRYLKNRIGFFTALPIKKSRQARAHEPPQGNRPNGRHDPCSGKSLMRCERHFK